eukprot:10323-Heterococcus_DN1.PRE.5
MVVVRVDKQTGKGSALDVIRMVNGTRSNHAAAHLRTILERYPEITLSKTKIDGKGRQTPVGSIEDLSSIIEKCPIVRNTSIAPSRLKTVLSHVNKVMKQPQPPCLEQQHQHMPCHVKQEESTAQEVQAAAPSHKNAFGPLSAMVSDTIEMFGSKGSVASVLMLLLGISNSEVYGVYNSLKCSHPEIDAQVDKLPTGLFASADLLHVMCESFEVSRPRRNFVHRCIDRDLLGIDSTREVDLREELHKRIVSNVEKSEQPVQRRKRQKTSHATPKQLSPVVRGAMRAYTTLKQLGLVPGMTQSEVTLKLKRTNRGVALLKYLGQ